MSPSCKYVVGFISRQECGENAIDTCKGCGIPVCERHGLRANGDFYCRKCLAKQETPSEGIHTDRIPVYESDMDVGDETFWDDLS